MCFWSTEKIRHLYVYVFQVCQVSAQQPVQTELLMRYHQLQSRLATLKIENEEVRLTLGPMAMLTESFAFYKD